MTISSKQLKLIRGACLSLLAVSCMTASANNPEETVIKALVDIQQGRMISAEQHLQPLLKQRPKFKLAHLLYSDVLNARAGSQLNLNSLGGSDRSSLDGLFAEARQRVQWSEISKSLLGKLPSALIKPNKDHPYIVFADLGLSRVFLFKQDSEGVLSRVHDFYASGGKKGTRKQVRGDQRTPLGVYEITSRLTDAELDDKYGPVAFPINYPNSWDQLQKRTGDGIWLHGVTSATYSRPPQDSDGCVALPNADLRILEPYLKIGAPVIFGENETWVEPNQQQFKKTELLKSIELWRQDWESLNSDRYLSHYAQEFNNQKHNFKTWTAYKRAVNAGKSYIQVVIDDPVIYGYPGEQDMVQVDFVQHYVSNNYRGKVHKQQYWKKQANGEWQITYEKTLRKI